MWKFSQLSRKKQDSIITFTDETVDQSRPMISERWPSLFGNILPTDFILRKINSGVVISIQKYYLHVKSKI
ncbi:unnamed protein product [Rhizophagus irregularis]|nr:unnamed protein product [Rhizophagus irregularis]